MRDFRTPRDMGEAIDLARKLPTYARLAWGLLRDNRVADTSKIVLMAAGAYVLMPFDILPDFIPVAGQIDDIAIVLMALRWFLGNAPEEVVREHLGKIAQNEDDLRHDLERAQRLLGERFATIRDEFDRMLARQRGRGDDQGGTTNGRP